MLLMLDCGEIAIVNDIQESPGIRSRIRDYLRYVGATAVRRAMSSL